MADTPRKATSTAVGPRKAVMIACSATAFASLGFVTATVGRGDRTFCAFIGGLLGFAVAACASSLLASKMDGQR
jgi:hypothetical protein